MGLIDLYLVTTGIMFLINLDFLKKIKKQKLEIKEITEERNVYSEESLSKINRQINELGHIGKILIKSTLYSLIPFVNGMFALSLNHIIKVDKEILELLKIEEEEESEKEDQAD